MQDKLVSIIISTKNEENNIRNLLESCVSQTYKNIEIILIDNNSTDNTKGITKEYTDKIYNIGPERSVQRNYGVKVSSGEFVLILDADMTLEPDVIAECIETISKDKNIKAVIIPEKSFGEGFWAKSKALERNCYIGDETIEAARFFSKEAYTAVGGFNEKMISGEDWDLTRKIRSNGWKVGRINGLINHNEGRLSLIRSIKKKYYYARMSGPYIEKNVGGLKDVFLFIFRPAYFRNWRLLAKDPIHTLGFIVMKTLELAVGGLAMIQKKFH